MCQLPVRGLVAWCQGCGHGGHAEHLHAWFQTNLECPTGCGHRCQIRYAAPVGRAVAQPLVPDPDGATARLASALGGLFARSARPRVFLEAVIT